MTDTRICRTCNAPKPLTREYWYVGVSRGRRYFRQECKSCYRDHWRPKGYLTFAERRAIAMAERDRLAQKAPPEYKSTIPDSDPWLDLEVIDACWSDCIEAGPDATRRMVKKIVAVSWNLYRAEDLCAAAVSCLDNRTHLVTVRSLLNDCVGLARAS